MRALLDSTIVIDYLRDVPEAVDRITALLEDDDIPLITEVVVCEVATGEPEPGQPSLQALLEQLEFIQPHYDIALEAGRWRKQAARRGRTLSLPDALIAAAAFGSDATVLTRNEKDFALTPARLERY